MNNAGIDDTLIGGIIKPEYAAYDIADQWASYGWNVFADGRRQRLRPGVRRPQGHGGVARRTDRRPMIVVGPTLKGWWPTAHDGQLPGFGDQLRRLPQPPLRPEDEQPLLRGPGRELRAAVRRRVRGHPRRRARQRAPSGWSSSRRTSTSPCRCMDRQPGLREWIADRLLATADTLDKNLHLGIDDRARSLPGRAPAAREPAPGARSR